MMIRVLLCFVVCAFSGAAHVRWDVRRQSDTDVQCALNRCRYAFDADKVFNHNKKDVTEEMVEHCRSEVQVLHDCLKSAMQRNLFGVCATCDSPHASLLDTLNASPDTLMAHCPQSCDVAEEENRECYQLCNSVVEDFNAKRLNEQDIDRIEQCDACSWWTSASCPHSNFQRFPEDHELTIQTFILHAKGCPARDAVVPCTELIEIDKEEACSDDKANLVPAMVDCWKQYLQPYPQCKDLGKFSSLMANSILAQQDKHCQWMKQGEDFKNKCATA